MMVTLTTKPTLQLIDRIFLLHKTHCSACLRVCLNACSSVFKSMIHGVTHDPGFDLPQSKSEAQKNINDDPPLTGDSM